MHIYFPVEKQSNYSECMGKAKFNGFHVVGLCLSHHDPAPFNF